MKLEDQICSLDLAKQLKKLGVKQDSYFYWLPSIQSPKVFYIEHVGYAPHLKGDEFAAFTVAELGAMLPTDIPNSEPLKLNKGLFGYGKTAAHQWQCMYYDVKFFNEETEADARAKMLIYLVKKELINIKSLAA